MTSHTTIDPRAPRFAAWITSALLLIATVFALTGIAASSASASFGWFAYQPLASSTFPGGHWLIGTASVAERASDPGFIIASVVAALFVWGLVSPSTSPWSVLFRTSVRPRLAPPVELEDARPPRFAQGVGLIVVAAGLVLHLAGVPLALPIATAAAFVAAFLNAAFGFCLGCQLYLLLQRVSPLGRGGASA